MKWVDKVLTLTLVLLLAMEASVSALRLTRELCDLGEKYYCSRAQWDAETDRTHVYFHEHRGGIDGGALKWQDLWLQDFAYNSETGVWDLLNAWRETGWQKNVPISVWQRHGANHLTYDRDDVLVVQKLRFENRDGSTGKYYFWCSERLAHYLHREGDQKEGRGGRGGC